MYPRFLRKPSQSGSFVTSSELGPKPSPAEIACQAQHIPLARRAAPVVFVDFRQILLGLSWLSAGIMVYVLARPPGVAFLPQSLSLYTYFPAQLAALTGPLPVFFHVGAMSYLTVGLLALGRRGALVACASWAAFDSLFELGQHDKIAAWLEPQIPAWFDQTPLVEITRSFFVRGTFDVLDIVAAVAAAICVFFLSNKKFLPRNST